MPVEQGEALKYDLVQILPTEDIRAALPERGFHALWYDGPWIRDAVDATDVEIIVTYNPWGKPIFVQTPHSGEAKLASRFQVGINNGATDRIGDEEIFKLQLTQLFEGLFDVVSKTSPPSPEAL